MLLYKYFLLIALKVPNNNIQRFLLHYILKESMYKKKKRSYPIAIKTGGCEEDI